jgi:hypothetical protein
MLLKVGEPNSGRSAAFKPQQRANRRRQQSCFAFTETTALSDETQS